MQKLLNLNKGSFVKQLTENRFLRPIDLDHGCAGTVMAINLKFPKLATYYSCEGHKDGLVNIVGKYIIRLVMDPEGGFEEAIKLYQAIRVKLGQPKLTWFSVIEGYFQYGDELSIEIGFTYAVSDLDKDWLPSKEDIIKAIIGVCDEKR